MGFEKFGRKSFASVTKTAKFVDILAEGKVDGTMCKKCGARFFPPRADCSVCFSKDMDWFEMPAKGKLETLSTDKTYGLRITRYESPHGTVNIVKHPLLTGTTYGNYAVMLDLECLTYRYLSNRDTKLLTNRQAPGEDSRVDEYLTECGLQFEQQKRHAVMSKSAL